MAARFRSASSILRNDGAYWIIAASLLSAAAWLFIGLSTHSASFGYDFAAYHAAAVRVAAGLSPYDPQLLLGVVDAKGAGDYLYPPPLAQLLSFTVGWPEYVAANAWVMAQTLLLMAGLWLAARAGGARRKAPIAAGALVLAVTSLPMLDSLLEGNVAGLIAFAVAVAIAAPGSLRAGGTLAVVGIIKLAPLALLLPAGRAGRRVWLGAALATVLITGTSFVLAPVAWHDWFLLVRGQLVGQSVYEDNLAPASAAALMGWTGLAQGLRILAPLAGAALILAAWRATAYRPVTAISLALLGSLLIPPVFWPHYLVPLLVPVAYVWTAATRRQRLGFAICLGLLSLSPFLTPLAWLGAVGVVLLVAAGETPRLHQTA